MKTLSYIGLALGAIAFGLSIYGYFVIIPKAADAQSLWEIQIKAEHVDSYYKSKEYLNLLQLTNSGIDFAVNMLYISIGVIVLNAITLIRKQKIAWVGILFGLVCLLFSLVYGSHIFA